MEQAAKVILAIAAVLAVVGAVLLVASRLGLDRLPGDLVIKRDGVTIYAPVGLMIVISVVATIVLTLLGRK